MGKYIPVDPEKWGEMVKAMAENRLLKVEVQHWQEQWHFVIQDNNKQMDENARLKAEVERLRASSFVTAVPVEQYERVVKAGDEMASEWVDREGLYHANEDFIANWNAAKEGNPSV